MASLLATIEQFLEGLGMEPSIGLFIPVVVGCFAFAARDVRLGAVALFILSGVITVIYVLINWDWFIPLVTMLLALVAMVLLMYAIKEGGDVQ